MKQIEIYYIDRRKIHISTDQTVNVNKALRAAAKEILLAKALGITLSSISENEYGKPILSYDNSRHFNISHGRDYSVIAVGDQELGIDIEEIKPDNRRRKYDEMTARRVFSKDYYDEYTSAAEDMKKYVFTRLWTQLEAILKANGTGFHLDPRKNPDIFQGWQIKNIDLSDHIISVAMHNDFSYTINECQP